LKLRIESARRDRAPASYPLDVILEHHMKLKLSRHTALIVGAFAFLGGSAALAATPSIDPTITVVMDDTELNEAMDKNDLHEEALNDVDDGAKDNLEQEQEGQQEAAEANQDAAEATQDAAEATQDGAHGGGDAHSMSNVEGV
jgi:cobalamin biosynthesis protein CobT